jgi:hypothetical protein
LINGPKSDGKSKEAKATTMFPVIRKFKWGSYANSYYGTGAQLEAELAGQMEEVSAHEEKKYKKCNDFDLL